MSATDVSDTLQVALRGSGLNQVKVLHRPRLLSDNGPSYASSELGKWLEDNGNGLTINRRGFTGSHAGSSHRAIATRRERGEGSGSIAGLKLWQPPSWPACAIAIFQERLEYWLRDWQLLICLRTCISSLPSCPPGYGHSCVHQSSAAEEFFRRGICRYRSIHERLLPELLR